MADGENMYSEDRAELEDSMVTDLDCMSVR